MLVEKLVDVGVDPSVISAGTSACKEGYVLQAAKVLMYVKREQAAYAGCLGVEAVDWCSPRDDGCVTSSGDGPGQEGRARSAVASHIIRAPLR